MRYIDTWYSAFRLMCEVKARGYVVVVRDRTRKRGKLGTNRPVERATDRMCEFLCCGVYLRG